MTTSIASDYQVFLKLMTAQLANQDPLAPMDASQFVTQLAQFSQVEQSVQTNSRLDQVVAALKASSTRADIAYVGREVEIASNALVLEAGAGEISYVAQGDARTMSFSIHDQTGAVIRTIEVPPAAGRQTFAWDGLDADGNTRPDGVYGVSVDAKGPDGKAVTVDTWMTDEVTQVRQSDGTTMLLLKSGLTVAPDAVVGVS